MWLTYEKDILDAEKAIVLSDEQESQYQKIKNLFVQYEKMFPKLAENDPKTYLPINGNSYILIDGESLDATLGTEYIDEVNRYKQSEYKSYLLSENYANNTVNALRKALKENKRIEIYGLDKELRVSSEPVYSSGKEQRLNSKDKLKKQLLIGNMERIAFFDKTRMRSQYSTNEFLRAKLVEAAEAELKKDDSIARTKLENKIKSLDSKCNETKLKISNLSEEIEGMKLNGEDVAEKERQKQALQNDYASSEELLILNKDYLNNPNKFAEYDPLSVFNTEDLNTPRTLMQGVTFAELIVNKGYTFEEAIDPTKHLEEKGKAVTEVFQHLLNKDYKYFQDTFKKLEAKVEESTQKMSDMMSENPDMRLVFSDKSIAISHIRNLLGDYLTFCESIDSKLNPEKEKKGMPEWVAYEAFRKSSDESLMSNSFKHGEEYVSYVSGNKGLKEDEKAPIALYAIDDYLSYTKRQMLNKAPKDTKEKYFYPNAFAGNIWGMTDDYENTENTSFKDFIDKNDQLIVKAFLYGDVSDVINFNPSMNEDGSLSINFKPEAQKSPKELAKVEKQLDAAMLLNSYLVREGMDHFGYDQPGNTLSFVSGDGEGKKGLSELSKEMLKGSLYIYSDKDDTVQKLSFDPKKGTVTPGEKLEVDKLVGEEPPKPNRFQKFCYRWLHLWPKKNQAYEQYEQKKDLKEKITSFREERRAKQAAVNQNKQPAEEQKGPEQQKGLEQPKGPEQQKGLEQQKGPEQKGPEEEKGLEANNAGNEKNRELAGVQAKENEQATTGLQSDYVLIEGTPLSVVLANAYKKSMKKEENQLSITESYEKFRGSSNCQLLEKYFIEKAKDENKSVLNYTPKDYVIPEEPEVLCGTFDSSTKEKNKAALENLQKIADCDKQINGNDPEKRNEAKTIKRDILGKMGCKIYKENERNQLSNQVENQRSNEQQNLGKEAEQKVNSGFGLGGLG